MSAELRESLIARLRAFRGPYLGDGVHTGIHRDELIAALTQPAPTSSTTASALSDEMRAFLWGEAPLEGVWFGEDHPTRKGRYWWRQLLPTAPTPDQPVADPLRKGR